MNNSCVNTKNRQSGQALLIIIFAITLGLVTLVAVSTRIVNSTKRVFIDNAYYKAQAMAEAGAEKFLLKTDVQLDALTTTCRPSSLYISAGFGPIPANCTLGTAVAEGFTEARAVMAVETYPSAGVRTYEVSSPANATVSINLVGASEVRVCWQGMNSTGLAYSEVLMFYYYTDAGNYKTTQKKYDCADFSSYLLLFSWCNSTGYTASDGDPADSVDGGYACFKIPFSGIPQMVNLMSLFNGSSYKITFTGITPPQGYKITSVGEVKSGLAGFVGSLASSTATRKKVVVEKSRMPNLGPWFNFAVASESGKICAGATCP